MAEASAASRLQPWAGWISSALALAINHQGMADAIYFRCGAGNPASAAILGLLALALAWTGGLISWAGRRSGGETPGPRTRLFISLVGVMLAALCSVAIAFQVLAGLIIPTCFR